MIILPYKKGLLKNVSYEKQIDESFYPNAANIPLILPLLDYLRSLNMPVRTLGSPISGKFADSVEPHDDADSSDYKCNYSFVYFRALHPIHFYADNDWIRIYHECIVMFNHAKTHAVLNPSKSSYAWVSFHADMEKGFKFPKNRTIPIVDESLSGVW